MIDPALFWKVPAYLPYVQPPLTTALIEEAEDQLGIKLPRAYLDLLRVQNGGYVRYTCPDTAHSQLWGIGPHYPNILAVHDWQLEPDEDEEFEREWAPGNASRLVPFDGDGHWYLCFDYRSTGPAHEPRISLIEFDSESDREIAASFDDFLKMLEEDVTWPTLGILEVSPDVTAEMLQKLLRVKFSEPNDHAHGYPVRRAQLQGGAKPDWVWLNPNRVPRGFVRREDRRYAEVKDLLPGTALLHPSVPQAETIVSCTPEVADKVMEACSAAGLKAVVIRG
jgi:hypothetical protein